MRQEQPPRGTDPYLSAYLRRMFDSVDRDLVNAGKLPINKILAPKPVVGKLYYYSQALSTEITGEGLYVYTTDGYKPCTT